MSSSTRLLEGAVSEPGLLLSPLEEFKESFQVQSWPAQIETVDTDGLT